MQEKGMAGKWKIKFTRDNFLIVILVGVLLLVIAWPVEEKNENLFEKNQKQSNQLDSNYDMIGMRSGTKDETADEEAKDLLTSYASAMERSLEELLSTMEGVGKVRVMVTLKDAGEAVVEKDVSKTRNGTTEVDSAGGSRNTTNITDSEATLYQNGQGSGGSPYVKKVLTPQVEGVVVSAQGADNTATVRNITEAIQALFGIEAHKIKIVKMISQ